jgi:hypothetical protein
VSEIAIRLLQPRERAVWQPLWTAYLDFYGATVSPETYDVTWRRLNDPAEPMFALALLSTARSVVSRIICFSGRAGASATIVICRICS